MIPAGEQSEYGFYDERAEQAVIGSLMDSPHVFADVQDKLTPEHFYTLYNKIVYEAVVTTFEKHGKFDAVMVMSQIVEDGNQNAMGGVEYIMGALEACPAPENVGYYAGVVMEAARKRQVYSAFDEGRRACKGGDVEQAIDDFHACVSETEQGGNTLSMLQVMNRALEEFAEQKESGVSPVKRTGIECFDRMVELVPGEYGIIGGVSGVGKSSLARQVVIALAQRNQRVLYLTTEMRHFAVACAFLAQLSGIPVQYVRDATQRLKHHEQAVIEAAAELSALPIEINSTPAMTVESLVSEIHKSKNRTGADVVVFDHLHELVGLGRRESKHEFYDRATGRILQVTQQLDIVTICMSQLSYQGNFRESSTIEQRAAWAVQLRPTQIAVPEMKQGDVLVECVIKKGRFVPKGVMPMLFRGSVMTFEELSDEQRAHYLSAIEVKPRRLTDDLPF